MSLFTEFWQYVFALLAIILAAWISYEFVDQLGYYVIAFILLILVSIMATILKTGPVLLASLISIVLWNFFFIPPHLTFHIEKTEDILMFGMFGLVVIMNGIFTTRVRRQEKMTRDREARTNALFQLTRELSKTSGVIEVTGIAQREIKIHFGLDAFIITRGETDNLPEFDHAGSSCTLPYDEYSIARWAYKNGTKAGKFTNEFSGSAYSYHPLSGTLIMPGVVVLKPDKLFTVDMEVFWNTFIAQIANALEREFLSGLAQKARFLDESDRFYKTLFNSVSHELRIPVATILAAADAMMNSANPGDMPAVLSREIYTATNRLNRLIENLLNMSRLESGRIAVRLDWYDLNDLLNKVISDLTDELKAYTLNVRVDDAMPLVRIDFGLMEQVLYNLIYNACQYAPAASRIMVEVKYVEGSLVIRVLDEGPGFPGMALHQVFDKFYRAGMRKTGGLGLGLSIVRGFVEAHRGSVKADNRPEGGAAITVVIPSELPEIDEINMDSNDD